MMLRVVSAPAAFKLWLVLVSNERFRKLNGLYCSPKLRRWLNDCCSRKGYVIRSGTELAWARSSEGRERCREKSRAAEPEKETDCGV